MNDAITTYHKSIEFKAKLSAMLSGQTNPAFIEKANAMLHVVSLIETQKRKLLFSEIPPAEQMTEMEKRVDFKFLQNQFDEIENELEAGLTSTITQDLNKSIEAARKKIKTGDLAALASLMLLSAKRIREHIVEAQKKAIEAGKKTASEEMKQPRPLTPRRENQLANFEATQVSEEFVNEVNSAAKQVAHHGISKNLPLASIVAAVGVTARNKASKMIINVKNTIPAESINRGRGIVFDEYANLIKGFQRSEILDSATCAMCLSLHGRIIKSDDPMAGLDLVHDNCRGIWLPILDGDPFDGKVGLPKTIIDSFDTIGGVPVRNSFTQLKKPLTGGDKEVQKLVKDKMKLEQ